MSLPHIPLHQTHEPQWLPFDESLESSLTLLERQEKEYNARLDAIATLAAPEPIGSTFVGGASGGGNRQVGVGSNSRSHLLNSSHASGEIAMMRRIASPSSTTSSRRRRYPEGSSASAAAAGGASTPNNVGMSMSTPPTRGRRSFEYGRQRGRISGGRSSLPVGMSSGGSGMSRGSRRRSYEAMESSGDDDDISFESRGGAVGGGDGMETLVSDLIRSGPTSLGSI